MSTESGVTTTGDTVAWQYITRATQRDPEEDVGCDCCEDEE